MQTSEAERQAERPSKINRTLSFDDDAGSDDDCDLSAAVSPFLLLLKNPDVMKNIQEHAKESQSLEDSFQAALDGSVDLMVYRSIAREISQIRGGMADDASTAYIFLGAVMDAAKKAAKALVDIQRESLVVALKTDKVRVLKRCDDGIIALKKDYEAKKKALFSKRDRDLALLDNKFRADHPVRSGLGRRAQSSQ